MSWLGPSLMFVSPPVAVLIALVALRGAMDRAFAGVGLVLGLTGLLAIAVVFGMLILR